MGIGGTAIVKECSDIIILEDNFTSIVKVSEISRINVVDIIFENDCNWKRGVCFKVIQWGRFLYTNAQRFLQFRLTVNASALIICVVVAVHSHEIPLNVAQVIFSLCIMKNSFFLSFSSSYFQFLYAASVD